MELKKLFRVGSSLVLGAIALFQPLTNVSLAAEEYNLNNSVNAYYTAVSAKEGVDPRSVYVAGRYYIYKEYNGMLNIAKQPDTVGGWINPADNKALQNNDESVKTKIGTISADGKKFELSIKTYGYMNALDAKNAVNKVNVLYTGSYYIYKQYNGMINISKTAGSPGSWINPNATTEVKPAIPQTGTSPSSPKLYTLSRFKWLGVINWNGYKYTWYSQKVLPGPGLRIPGRHVNVDGYVADENGYIVLANDAPMGKVFPTPFGYLGKVYDRGTYGNHLDVYVN